MSRLKKETWKQKGCERGREEISDESSSKVLLL
jgi:hypothetical protein